MIFSEHVAHKVKAGAKTQTRRRIKPGETRCRYVPGRHYAVQPGRGKPAICRIEIVTIERQRLGDITDDQARAEGFNGRHAFLRDWCDLHRLRWPMTDRALDAQVWAIEFKLWHRPRPLRPDRPRILAATSGYTARPDEALRARERDHVDREDDGGGAIHMIDPRYADIEPEAVDPETQARITERAHMLDRQAWERDRAELDALDPVERLRRALDAARRLGVEVDRNVLSIERRIEAMESRIRKRSAETRTTRNAA